MRLNIHAISIALFLLFSSIACASDFFSVQVGSFIILRNAKGVVCDLRNKDIECRIVNEDGFHKVHCGEFGSMDEALYMRDKLRSTGFRDAFAVNAVKSVSVVSCPLAETSLAETTAATEEKIPVPLSEDIEPEAEQGPAPVLVVAEEVLEGEAAGKAPAPSYEQGRISWDMLKKKGGYFHPFLSISEVHTDNLFGTASGEVSDYVTVVSPGVWLAAPGSRKARRWKNISAHVPGGGDDDFPGSDRVFQAYLIYQADVEKFKESSSQDFTHHKAEGKLLFNSRGGIGLGLSGRFLKSRDSTGAGLPGDPEDFFNYRGGAALSYQFARLRLKAEYAGFLADYGRAQSEFRNRRDDVYSGYVFYKTTAMTSAFLQYEYIDIDYDTDVLPDSVERNYFGGLEWDVTAKSTGRVKAGYGVREKRRDPLGEGNETFVLAGRLRHNFTPKTFLNLSVSREREEVDVQTSEFVLSNSVRADYAQRFTRRVSVSLSASYDERTFDTFGGAAKQRKDEIYRGVVAFRYEAVKWFFADIGYAYTERASNADIFDFRNNRVFFRITASL